MDKLLSIFAILIFSFSVSACIKSKAESNNYVWQNIAAKSDYAISYNYPVFTVDGKMLALNDGGWFSENGKNWTKTELPKSRLNSAYQKFVQFKGAIYALGEMEGNYLNFKLVSKITRTRDGKTWETVAEKSNLPNRVFYGAVVFKDKIWLIGGFDGKNYHNDVWNSDDGVHWNLVTKKSAWSERTISKIVVFKDKMWIIGGGVIDGEKEINPNSASEIWSSADGEIWKKHQTNATNKIAGTPVVFDDKLWLVGANRNNGNFASAVLVSDDGENWQELSAPWTPRGAVAVWVFNNKLFMTGGKYSYNENGEMKFVYSNDVWAMSKLKK
jgi:Kelch motif